jgi:hypothetical protein
MPANPVSPLLLCSLSAEEKKMSIESVDQVLNEVSSHKSPRGQPPVPHRLQCAPWSQPAVCSAP